MLNWKCARGHAARAPGKCEGKRYLRTADDGGKTAESVTGMEKPGRGRDPTKLTHAIAADECIV